MSGRSVRHAVVFDELVEWWEDLSRGQIGSQAVLVPVPSRWGRTTLLKQFAAIIEAEEAVNIVVAIDSASLPDGLGLQAQKLRDVFRGAHVNRRVAELLGVDRLGGIVQLGLAVGGLFATPLAAMLGLLLAEEGVGAAGRLWDTSPAGHEGAVARLARAVAAVSVSLPVVVVIDDADRLDPAVAVTLIENLIERADGQVLVVAATDPGSELASALISQARYGLTEGRVHKAEVSDPDMGYQARAELAAELCPWLPTIATRHIARRVATFADVFAVARAERLAELDPSGDENAITAAVDEVIDARPDQADPSPEAVVLAWAGGVLHAIQAERALAVLGARRSGTDQYVVRLESLVRLADPASPRLAEQVTVLGTSTRHRLAAAVLDTAVRLGADPGAGLVERVVAWQAAHRVRADLQDREQVAGVQRQLVRGLEDLGDSAAAYEVAKTALTEYLASHPGGQATRECDELSAAVLRLARTSKKHRDDPLIEITIASALAGGAAVGLEARVWAAVDLLDRPGSRETALKLVDEVTAELATLTNLGPVGDRWRLLLAFHVGRAGYAAVTQRVLTPMLNASTEQGDAARAVLFAVGGPGADTRLQIVALEAELQAVPADAEDDRLRLHRALGSDYAQLGDYHRALEQGRHELALRRHIQGADHPDTLRARGDIAEWAGYSGDPVEARRLLQELLPDLERVLGHDHPDTLATRGNLARWTGHSGHPVDALRLLQELLPDLERVHGHDHPNTLATRGIIAELTGESGDPARALHLFQELLPDKERVLGPHHPEVLTTRNNMAVWTGQSGDPARALRLLQELLPDVERVLGRDRPDTLATRNSIAEWTGESGNRVEALRLAEELLPDQERVLGHDHPNTLTTRNNIAVWTGESGDPARALHLFQELLPDEERVLGPDHPEVLTTRNNIAASTAEYGDRVEALRLAEELLPDQERVLGPSHPNTLATRNNIAVWTGQSGDPAGALRLFQELLPDVERVLGQDHPKTLATRYNIATWTDECGDPARAPRLFQELLPDQERVLGRDHPATLATRSSIALWTAYSGDPAEALRLAEELLPDQERVLGPDHPNTLATRNNIADWTGQSGDPAGALRLLQELLPDLERVLGPDHPNTLATRNNIAVWTGQSGEPAGALRLFQELLPDVERFLGPDHPNTLATRNNMASWTGELGEPAGALRLLQGLLPDLERVLGPDDPATLATRQQIERLNPPSGSPDG